MSNLYTGRRTDDIHVKDVNVQQFCVVMANMDSNNKHYRDWIQFNSTILTTQLMIFMWKMWTCSSRVVAAAAIDQCETGRKRPLQSHLSHHQQHHHPQQHHHHQQQHHPQQHQCHHCRFVDFVIAVKLGVLSSKGQRLKAHFLRDVPCHHNSLFGRTDQRKRELD